MSGKINRLSSLFSGSNLTGTPMLVADVHTLTASLVSSTTSASVITFVVGSMDGLQAALPTSSPSVSSNGWSILTQISQQGMYGFATLGFRWLNAYRDGNSVSASSNYTCIMSGRE